MTGHNDAVASYMLLQKEIHHLPHCPGPEDDIVYLNRIADGFNQHNP